MLVLFGVFLVAYSVLLEMQLIVLGAAAAVSHRRRARNELAAEEVDLARLPGLSIVMPAFNEEIGIVEAVRSMAMNKYPLKELVIVNDGSTDATLSLLVDTFDLRPVCGVPYPDEIPTETVHGLYRGRIGVVPIVVVDKDNGGRGDAVNAGVNVARGPLLLVTDADVVMDPDALVKAARPFVDDPTTVATGGNVRPANGCSIRRGQVERVGLPSRWIELVQVVEYVRSFVATRPGWSLLGVLPLVSGAFGMFRRDSVVAVGGYHPKHLGEDLELTLHLHRHFRQLRRPYKITYVPDAIVWTELPATREALRKQRIRWHRGLFQVVVGYAGMLGNPRYGMLGLVVWPAFVAFEFAAPLLEGAGWMVLGWAMATGRLNVPAAAWLMVLVMFVGALNTLVALALDLRFGVYTAPSTVLRLVAAGVADQFGYRQLTVWWRLRAMVWNPINGKRDWEVSRVGLTNLAS